MYPALYFVCVQMNQDENTVFIIDYKINIALTYLIS